MNQIFYRHETGDVVPLDPALAAIAGKARSLVLGDLIQARIRQKQAVLAARELTGLPEVESTVDCVATWEGLNVPIRIYRSGGGSSQPTLLFFHGGGFVLGSVEVADNIARKFCRDMAAVVVSVEYRLAPEHPFPAAHDDALAATLWAVRNVSDLGGDPTRVGVMGESAGANLATAAAIACRDRRVPLAGQLLIVPGVDLARDIADMARKLPEFPMLSVSDLAEFARLYMGARLREAIFCPPSPWHAADLSEVAPALIAVAGHDPLQAEGIAYADRLEAAGVRARVLYFGDMFHPFLGFFETSPGARKAIDIIGEAFGQLFRA